MFFYATLLEVVNVDEKSVGLTAKEERFCLEYIVDYNGAAAARRAGYGEKAAAKQACRLMHRPEVMAHIKALQAEQRERLCVSADLVVIRTMELLNVCMAATPVMKWDYQEHEMVPTGEYQVDSKGAAKALEILAKHLGMDGKGAPTGMDELPVFYSGEDELKD